VVLRGRRQRSYRILYYYPISQIDYVFIPEDHKSGRHSSHCFIKFTSTLAFENAKLYVGGIYFFQEVGIPFSKKISLERRFPQAVVFSNLYNDQNTTYPKGSRLGKSAQERYSPNTTIASTHKWGVAIILNRELGEYASAILSPPYNARIITVCINKPGLPTIIIINYYAHASNKGENERMHKEILTHVNDLYAKYNDSVILLCGDANSISSPINSNNPNNKHYFVSTLLNNNLFTDTYRAYNQNKEAYTHYQHINNFTFKKRIDYLLNSPNITNYIDSCKIGHINELPSDHRAVFATFNIPLKHNITHSANNTFLPLEHYIALAIKKQINCFTKEQWVLYKKH